MVIFYMVWYDKENKKGRDLIDRKNTSKHYKDNLQNFFNIMLRHWFVYQNGYLHWSNEMVYIAVLYKLE